MHTQQSAQLTWTGPADALRDDTAGLRAALESEGQPIFAVEQSGRIHLTTSGTGHFGPGGSLPAHAYVAPISAASLGDRTFQRDYGVRFSYASGAMANAIASTDLVIAMGRQQILASFGAAGVIGPRLEQAIQTIQAALPNGPYAFNLIHSPAEEAMERGAVELYLRYGVRVVEASAFLDLTPHIVWYRAAGLSANPDGSAAIHNRVIAKVSRREVAEKFMSPAPERLLRPLVTQGLITEQQAQLAARVPMADDITVEADSGGHTDNRPLVAVLPAIISLRDELQTKYGFPTPVRVGAAGGIGTPTAAAAAFTMGAAYVVTGSINQACVEAGASEHTRKLLAQADIADVMMAPAADMFEMGVKVQLLKRGTFFPMRAQKLYEVYREYDSIDAIPSDERAKLEKQIFRRPMADVWQDTVAYFQERDPEQIARAEANPKRKMALVFRWYLGLSSRWSNTGEQGREVDYQIWCGPSMGAFNNWTQGTYLEGHANRRVAEVGVHIMRGAAYALRVQTLAAQGVSLPPALSTHQPRPELAQYP